ncbi:HAD family hydrolase [Streptomyces sp. NPDC001380]|uniref:HAD family hydrolase n=1 Tax=Streptomyces sp. NPDC001380 TaxID=3364566 RepID=UPI0036BFD828
MRCCEEFWAAFPDALPALDALGGYRHGVLSNASLARQERKPVRPGMRDRFSCLPCSDRLGTARPDPRAFRAACDALGLPPQRVAYVGDRLDLDALGARDAGRHGVRRDRAGTGGDPPPGVHRVRTLADLPGLPRRVTG